jgi:hypothetical protein
MKLTPMDPLWARAWIRVLRGEHPWPSRASRGEHAPKEPPREASVESVWAVLGIGRDASEEELKAAYRKRALETHPDRGGSEETFRRVVRAYAEAQRRSRRPRRK